jgi:hypothetical protein
MVYLADYYKHLNGKRQLLLDTISRLESEQATFPKYLKELADELQVQVGDYSEDDEV